MRIYPIYEKYLLHSIRQNRSASSAIPLVFFCYFMHFCALPSFLCHFDSYHSLCPVIRVDGFFFALLLEFSMRSGVPPSSFFVVVSIQCRVTEFLAIFSTKYDQKHYSIQFTISLWTISLEPRIFGRNTNTKIVYIFEHKVKQRNIKQFLLEQKLFC